MTEVRMKAFVFGPAASFLINCTRSVLLRSCRMVRIKFKEKIMFLYSPERFFFRGLAPHSLYRMKDLNGKST